MNFYDEYNIKVVKTDEILPPKRPRKIHIPKRHGLYDYGAKNWEERIIRLECDLKGQLTRAEMREISYHLSKKGRLYLWDEPDKFYIGEIYTGGEIFDYPLQFIRTFVLEFICEPFAYREAESFELTEDNIIKYMGTAETPCIIEIEPEDRTAENIVITQILRR